MVQLFPLGRFLLYTARPMTVARMFESPFHSRNKSGGQIGVLKCNRIRIGTTGAFFPSGALVVFQNKFDIEGMPR
jgi:hypothetical protein